MRWDAYHHHKFPVRREDQVGELRRLIAENLHASGFDEQQIARAGLVVTEIAKNLLKHTEKGGEILYRTRQCNGRRELEVISLDRGPGISNISLAMQDGFSTAGSPGIGLGTIQRNVDAFEIFSRPGAGTAILVRMWKSTSDGEADEEPFAVGGVAVPASGETCSGDGWFYHHRPGELTVAVVDGLGHGEKAKEAATRALETFSQCHAQPLSEILAEMNLACRGTRGAAAGVARINTAEQHIRFAGIGNISASVVAPDGMKKGIPSINGILGMHAGQIPEQTAVWHPGNYLVMHSDGLLNRWDGKWIVQRPRELTLKAALMYRDFGKGHDDATVLIAKLR